MATQLRHDDPVRLDRLISWGASATRRTISGPHKQYARALGIDRSRATRHMQGDAHSPATRWLVALDKLARDNRTSAIPLISEAMAVVNAAEIEAALTEQLHARRKEITRIEHDLERDENRCTQELAETEDYAGAAEIEMRKVDLHLERALIYRELAKRSGAEKR